MDTRETILEHVRWLKVFSIAANVSGLLVICTSPFKKTSEKIRYIKYFFMCLVAIKWFCLFKSSSKIKKRKDTDRVDPYKETETDNDQRFSLTVNKYMALVLVQQTVNFIAGWQRWQRPADLHFMISGNLGNILRSCKSSLFPNIKKVSKLQSTFSTRGPENPVEADVIKHAESMVKQIPYVNKSDTSPLLKQIRTGSVQSHLQVDGITAGSNWKEAESQIQKFNDKMNRVLKFAMDCVHFSEKRNEIVNSKDAGVLINLIFALTETCKDFLNNMRDTKTVIKKLQEYRGTMQSVVERHGFIYNMSDLFDKLSFAQQMTHSIKKQVSEITGHSSTIRWLSEKLPENHPPESEIVDFQVKEVVKNVQTLMKKIENIMLDAQNSKSLRQKFWQKVWSPWGRKRPMRIPMYTQWIQIWEDELTELVVSFSRLKKNTAAMLNGLEMVEGWDSRSAEDVEENVSWVASEALKVYKKTLDNFRGDKTELGEMVDITRESQSLQRLSEKRMEVESQLNRNASQLVLGFVDKVCYGYESVYKVPLVANVAVVLIDVLVIFEFVPVDVKDIPKTSAY